MSYDLVRDVSQAPFQSWAHMLDHDSAACGLRYRALRNLEQGSVQGPVERNLLYPVASEHSSEQVKEK